MTVTDVVLHLGMGKTGSSSLQVALVRNREQLARLGIRYPEHVTDARARRGQAMSGNGLALQACLAPKPGTTEEQSDAALDGLFAEIAATTQPTIAYSSEFLAYFDVDRLRSLHGLLQARGVRLRSVIYVRDVAGHAISSYAEHVKRARYTVTLPEYLDEYVRWPAELSMGPRVQALDEILGADNCLVIHYDSVRKELFESFMDQTFGIQDLTDFDLSRDDVNRSLTAQEVEWMRYLNARLESPVAATAVSDQIVGREPLERRSLVLTRDEVALLDARFGKEVAWINDHFFPDGRLSIEGGATIVDEREAPAPLTSNERFLLDCLAGLGNEWPPQRRSRPKATNRKKGAAAPSPSELTAYARVRRRLRRHLHLRRGDLRAKGKDPGRRP
ncbi:MULTISPECIES: hypothetical protein [Nocardioides]|uniref:Sulfotransferase family protein n=1 Tax=Nocardioides vastitatis TaxID=2568655 RepID=A0ABW0ZMB8_9ACTN|nr:hypothetical protein [Nocardioides sp.]THI93751.1 hypothetical protein E7Z54_20630 [Nocardioides sp.]